MAHVGDVIMVLTAKNLPVMFQEGGSGHWKASANRIKRYPYVVAVHNGHNGWTQKHHAAFLIGKISGVTPSDDNRVIINFSEYAEIEIPDAWPGNRNPVVYTSTDALKIDISKLTWTPFPADMVVRPEAKPLTIDEAKRGIARLLGIGPEAIEITIRT